MNRVLCVFGLALALTGCDLIEAASKDRPNSAQKDAVGDIFSQAGTIADVFSDPEAASSSDFGEVIDFDHFAIASDPDFRTHLLTMQASKVQAQRAVIATNMIKTMLQAPPPGCVNKISENEFELVDCDVFMPDGGICLMTASGVSTDEAGGTRYTGDFTLKPHPENPSAVCPPLTIDINLFMAGPSSSPSVVSGVCQFDEKDDMGNIVWKGYIQLKDVAIEDPCTVPSTGSFVIAMKGTYKGKAIDRLVEISFNKDPSCGAMFLERAGAYEDPS